MSDGIHDERWTQIEAALRQSQTLSAAGQFAAAIMHEINNPLEAISTLTYLIQVEADDPDKVRQYSRQVGEQLGNVNRIERRTLRFHRFADVMEPIDLRVLAEAALRVHDSKPAAKQPTLVKDIPAGASVIGHAGEMLQVLSNLLSNSIDALPPNGRLVIRVRKHRGKVHLTVLDDGHGILRRFARTSLTHFHDQDGAGDRLGASYLQVHHRSP